MSDVVIVREEDAFVSERDTRDDVEIDVDVPDTFMLARTSDPSV